MENLHCQQCQSMMTLKRSTKKMKTKIKLVIMAVVEKVVETEILDSSPSENSDGSDHESEPVLKKAKKTKPKKNKAKMISISY